MNQVMVDLQRATPKGLEDLGRITYAGDKVQQKPTPDMRFQLILMTEQRMLCATFLNGLISALPRHDVSNERQNKVLSTDVLAQAGGARRTKHDIRVDIHTARPGIVIGRRGAEADRIRGDLEKLTGKRSSSTSSRSRTPRSRLSWSRRASPSSWPAVCRSAARCARLSRAPCAPVPLASGSSAPVVSAAPR